MNDNPILIIDCNYLCWAAYHTTEGLTDSKGRATGIIFGFLSRILSLANLFRTNSIIFCWDSRHSLRKEIYPLYKANRRKDLTPEEKREMKKAFHQFFLLRKRILPAMGFGNVHLQKGLEADDLIAKTIWGQHGDFIIVGADEDLFQCLFQNNVKMFNPQKKKMMTKLRFWKEYDIEAKRWIEVKTLAGCRTDNVKGIPGVGEKTAIKWIRRELKKGSTIYERIHSFSQKKLKRIEEVVRLPHRLTRPIVKMPDHWKPGNFRRICKKYDFDSFLSDSGGLNREWSNFFLGLFEEDKQRREV